MSERDMHGEVALITGGGIGLGRSIARLFAARGARVVIAEINESSGREAVNELCSAGAAAELIVTDVSREDDVRQLLDTIVKTHGRLDYAVNNAAIEGEILPLAEQSSEVFQKVIAVNLAGVFYGLKYQLPVMVGQGKGSIVNVSSVAGVRAHPGLAPYVAAKHGVNGLTKTAAIEYGPHGVRVNSLCPGGILTPQLARYLEAAPELRAAIIDANPLRRLAEPEEMAQAALWLCSSHASYVNGHEFVVDGGRTVSDC